MNKVDLAGVKMLPPDWTFNILALRRNHHTMPLTIDLFPQRREVSIALNPCTGGSAELQSGVFFRHVLGCSQIKTINEPTDLTKIESLCKEILSGYHAEQLWSGDWHCRWTPSAWLAAEALCKTIERHVLE